MDFLTERLEWTISALLAILVVFFGGGCLAEVSHRVAVTELQTETTGRVEVTQPDLSKLPVPLPLTAKEKAAALEQAATEREPPPGGDG